MARKLETNKPSDDIMSFLLRNTYKGKTGNKHSLEQIKFVSDKLFVKGKDGRTGGWTMIKECIETDYKKTKDERYKMGSGRYRNLNYDYFGYALDNKDDDNNDNNNNNGSQKEVAMSNYIKRLI